MASKTKIILKHGRHAPPENETPEQRFMRLAQPRMRNAIRSIRLIGNLSGSGYAWNQEAVVRMEMFLTETLGETFKRFQKSGPTKVRAEDRFKLVVNQNDSHEQHVA